MRSSHAAPLAGALAGALLAACSLASTQAPDPSRVVLRAGDLPSGLDRCPGSGEVGAYLRAAGGAGNAAHTEVAGAWHQLQQEGADAAAVGVWAVEPSACSAELGSGQGRGALAIVARLRDSGAALAAWRKGLLSFPAPPADEQEPGLTQGVATQLGEHAWIVERDVRGRHLTVAAWQNQSLIVFFAATDLPTDSAKRAMLAMDKRIV